MKTFTQAMNPMHLRLFALNHDSTYPLYNIEYEEVENGCQFTISIALAGFTKDEIKVSREKGTGNYSGLDLIKVSAEKIKDTADTESSRKFLVHNIAHRNATRKFPVARACEVTSVEYTDGILKINLLETVPEEDKPVTFEIK